MDVTKISELDLSKAYTYADYLKWRFEERVELIKGRIFKMSPAPRRKHQEISRDLEFLMIQRFQKKTCNIYNAPFDVRLPQSHDKKSQTVVQPDICVICDESKLDEYGCNGAPDLIVEIASPTTIDRDYKLKYELYQEHGVKEYWIVGMDGYVDKFVLKNGNYENQGKYFRSDLLKSAIFPELQIPLDQVFQDEV